MLPAPSPRSKPAVGQEGTYGVAWGSITHFFWGKASLPSWVLAVHILTGLCVPDPDRICGVAEGSPHWCGPVKPLEMSWPFRCRIC